MLNLTLREVAAAMKGHLHGDDLRVQGVSTDTRKDVAGTLFFALKGENHNGHDHVAKALAQGAVAAVVDHHDASFEPCIVVADTQRALGLLAGAWRAQQRATVIAITGNSGKTTTKEFVAAVLRQAGNTLATEGNLNNEIGVPLTLLQMNATHRFAVIEMGQGRPHDIAYLVGFTRPDIALITNVTGAHLAGFGTLEAIAAGKGEVFSQLPPEGVAIINADDAFAATWRAQLPPCRALTFGAGKGVDVRAEAVKVNADGCAHFTLHAGGERCAVVLATPGAHNVSNALAAASVGIACGVALPVIAQALAGVTPVAGRLLVRKLASGVRLVDDTYNANPGSVKAAINALCAYAGRHLLVLGHMAELGPDAAALHRDVGAYASTAGVDALFVLGDFAEDTANGFGRDAQVFADVGALIAALSAEIHALPPADVTVLIKGSRSARMERVVMALTGEKDAALAH